MVILSLFLKHCDNELFQPIRFIWRFYLILKIHDLVITVHWFEIIVYNKELPPTSTENVWQNDLLPAG